MSQHLPVRPTWLCASCDLSWPCPAKRQQLLDDHHGSTVSVIHHLGSMLADACRDLAGSMGPREIRAQLIGWVRQRRGAVNTARELDRWTEANRVVFAIPAEPYRAED